MSQCLISSIKNWPELARVYRNVYFYGAMFFQRSCPNKATEILIFSELLGTYIAIFTEKANLTLNLKQ